MSWSREDDPRAIRLAGFNLGDFLLRMFLHTAWFRDQISTKF